MLGQQVKNIAAVWLKFSHQHIGLFRKHLGKGEFEDILPDAGEALDGLVLVEQVKILPSRELGAY